MDVDLVVMAENLKQIGRELEGAGFRVKGLEHSMNAQRPGSKLNVQFTTHVCYQDFSIGAVEREVLGVAVPVASLENIVRGKAWAWQEPQRRPTKRKKDELDLMRIADAHPELRELIPTEIVKQL